MVVTWLAESADRLSGGKADHCTYHREHSWSFATADLLHHPIADWPTCPLQWVQPVYVGPSVAGYCPADQDVSRTIASCGIWDGFGSVLAAQILYCDRSTVIDFGANVGWFTNLAGAMGHDVLAVDADQENIDACLLGWEVNEWTGDLRATRGWIGPESDLLDPHPVRLAKVDIEGAEPHAVAVLASMISKGSIDFLMMEASPIFGDDVRWTEFITGGGRYRGYVIPTKGYDVDAFTADPMGATLDWGPLPAMQIDQQADVLFVRGDLL